MPRLRPIVAIVLAALATAPAAHAAAPFRPMVRAEITDHHTGKRQHPGLRVTILQKEGEAALSRVSVRLPRELRPSIAALKRTCPQAVADAGTCPRSSIIGGAIAVSATLGTPLEGPIVLAEPPVPPEGQSGIGLPDLSVRLTGGLVLRGQQRLLSTGRLQTIFEDLPPVAVQRFTLRFAALKDGPLEAAVNLCHGRNQRLAVVLSTADGRSVRRAPHLWVPCRR